MRKLSFLFFVALFAVFAYNASAVKVTTTTGIETWLVAAVPGTGDAVAEGHPTDWIEQNIGITEADLSKPENGPEEGDTIVDDPAFAWKVVNGDEANNYFIDFQRADVFSELDNIVAYMYLYVTSDKDRTVTILGGSDDCLKVFVNGEMLWDNPALRGWAANQDVIADIKLKAGKNGILFKITEAGGGWAGWGRIEPIDGLKASTTKTSDGDPIPEPISVSVFLTQFLNLLVAHPNPDAALEAQAMDLIAEASGGAMTEEQAAMGIGVARGVKVGDEAWTEGEFTDFGGDNLQILAQEVFGREGDQNNLSWYGFTVIISPDARDVALRSGSDDAIKIWVNGEVVHDNPVLRGASGFLDSADIHLNPGPNTLLVKVSEQGGGWSGFVGFDNIAAYNGLIVDSSETSVTPHNKISTTWGDIKNNE